MRQDSPAKTLAWMATGAAVLAAGAVLGSAAGRRKDRRSRREGDAVPAYGPLEDLAESVASLEARVQAAERAAAANAEAAAARSAERVEAIWQRVVEIEERLEQIQAERAEAPPLDAIVAEAESRLSPRLQALESSVAEHNAAVQQLQEQALQTEANLRKMIAAVEKLADQVARILPLQAQRIEPNRASAAGVAAGEPVGRV